MDLVSLYSTHFLKNASLVFAKSYILRTMKCMKVLVKLYINHNYIYIIVNLRAHNHTCNEHIHDKYTNINT